MKFRHLFYLFASLSMVLSACESDDETSGNNEPPEVVLPSAEFRPNSLTGAYAEDAIRIEAEDRYNAPFSSIELMQDGYYLFTSYNMYNGYTSSACAAAGIGDNPDINNGHKVIYTRSTTDENGTISFNDSQYGKFTKLGDKKYRLSNGIEIDLQDAAKVRLKYPDGTVRTVYASVIPPMQGDATRSLCRTWDYISHDVWCYWNGKYIARGQKKLENGQIVDSHFKVIGDMFEEEEIFDDVAYRDVFTPTGIFIRFFVSEDVEINTWRWDNEQQGIICEYEPGKDDESSEYWTVRFSGNEMRFYHDVRYSEDGENVRTVAVQTLTAAN